MPRSKYGFACHARETAIDLRQGPCDLGRQELPLHSVPRRAACHRWQGRRQRFDRILHTAGHNHVLTMTVLRNRLLLTEAGIAPVIIDDEDALRLVKAIGAGSPGGATTPPLLGWERPARRAPRFASPGGWWWAVRAHARGWLPSAL